LLRLTATLTSGVFQSSLDNLRHFLDEGDRNTSRTPRETSVYRKVARGHSRDDGSIA